jgi:hypothetical protein
VLAKGRFPADVREELQRERIVLLGEAIQATVRGEDLRAAGVPKGRSLAAFALTQQRLSLYLMGAPLVDVTWDEGRAREIDLSVVDRGVELGFDGSLIEDGRPGRIVVLLRLPDPDAVVAAIEQRRRPLDPRRHVRD